MVKVVSGKFDSIGDDRLRDTLVSDFAELQACIQSKAWKAALVLSGSIVEAILIDYLKEVGNVPGGKDPIRMTLAEAIDYCLKASVISNRAANLASVVREYRNWIHPGLQYRLQENPDENAATVAMALIDMITGELSTKRGALLGYTAIQLTNKLRIDKYAEKTINHFLKEMKKGELKKLLLSAIPDQYFHITAELDAKPPEAFLEDPEYDNLVRFKNSLSSAFRSAYMFADDDIKKEVSDRFLALLREASGDYIEAYALAFFRGSDLQYVRLEQRGFVKDHLISQLQSSINESKLTMVKGLEHFLDSSEVSKLADPIIRTAASSSNDSLRQNAKTYLMNAFVGIDQDVQTAFKNRLKQWIDFSKNRGQKQVTENVEEILNYYEIPF